MGWKCSLIIIQHPEPTGISAEDDEELMSEVPFKKYKSWKLASLTAETTVARKEEVLKKASWWQRLFGRPS